MNSIYTNVCCTMLETHENREQRHVQFDAFGAETLPLTELATQI